MRKNYFHLFFSVILEKIRVNFIKSNLDIWNAQHNKLPVLRLPKKIEITHVSEIKDSSFY